MAKIVLATIGTVGDLNPYLALGIELHRRGHSIIVATSPAYQQKVTSFGLHYALLRPSIDYSDATLAKQTMDRMYGTEFVLKDLLMTPLRDTYADLLSAVDGADLLISHSLCFAAPIVADKTGISWLSAVLSPTNFWSCHDPLVLPNAPFLRHAHLFGSRSNRMILKLARFATRDWLDAVYQLRKELYLRTISNPLFEGMHAPEGVLALFSGVFAPPRADWPDQVIQTGFLELNESVEPRKDKALCAFLDEGPKPIVFTLGTAAVLDADTFYEDSLQACRKLGQRAVLLTGPMSQNVPNGITEAKDVFQTDYLPYNMLFSHAKVVVHHGGIGTTAQVLKAGCPSLVVPYSHDQPDNADRLRRLGVARVAYRHRLTSKSLADNIGQLINKPSYTESAKIIQQQMAHENGLSAVADIVEIKLEELAI